VTTDYVHELEQDQGSGNSLLQAYSGTRSDSLFEHEGETPALPR
jgi:hypothetical protein